MSHSSHAIRLGALGFAAVLLAGCGTVQAQTHPAKASHNHRITLVDDMGTKLTLPGPATRIVTIAPSNTEIALDLGLKSEIVGTDATTFEYAPAPWSHELKGLHDIGASNPGVSVEQIVATRPDLVIAIPGVKGLSSLSRFHIPVLILDPQSVQGIYRDIDLVGEATGRSRQAAQVVSHLRGQMTALQQLVKTQSHHSPTVFYDLGGLYTAGPDSYINTLLTMAGAKNVTDEFSHSAYPQVTPEQVVKANPQMIIYDPSGASVPVVDALPGFSHVTAVQNDDVVSLPHHSYVNEPSPAVAMGLYVLIHLIHPHLRIPHDLVKNL